MSASRRPIVAVMTVTEPRCSHYLTYYAAVASWAQHCDRVVVVDGWSDEDLLETPQALFGPLENVEILRNEITHWGSGVNWHASQHSVNIHAGLSAAGDNAFVFVVDADQVLYPPDQPLRELLPTDAKPPTWFRFYRSKFSGNDYVRRLDNSGRLFLSSLTAQGRPQIAIGYDTERDRPSDFPVFAEQIAYFRDPLSGTIKELFAGPPAPAAGLLEIDCGTFGHFWFTPEQCLAKLNRYAQVVSRLFGVALPRQLELQLKAGRFGITRFRGKSEMLELPLPPAMLRLVEEYYQPGMLGGAVYGSLVQQPQLARARERAFRLERWLRTKALRTRGYRGLYDLHTWRSTGDPAAEPVDVGQLYDEQDRYLGSRGTAAR